MTIILETKRLILRHQVMEDLDDLWALYQNPTITKYIPDAPLTREEAQEELEWHMHGHSKHPELGLWATIHKEAGKFIGRCGLLPWTIDGQNEVEEVLMKDFRVKRGQLDGLWLYVGNKGEKKLSRNA
jgi:RimJ/RimL family protein N-acetyltransferase